MALIEGRSAKVRTWALYAPLVVFSASLSAGTWDARRQGGVTPEVLTGQAFALWMVGLSVGALLLFRQRYRVEVVIGTAVATIILPLDPIIMLIAWSSLLAHTSRLRAKHGPTVILAGLITLATSVSIWRDGQGTTIDSSLFHLMSAPESTGSFEPITYRVVAMLAITLVGAAAAIGLVMRSSRQAETARGAEALQRASAHRLASELVLQQEREALARDVHDALGHHLSLISLNAGVFEVHPAVDRKLAEAARQIGASARQAAIDLAGLLLTIRHAQPSGTPAQSGSIAQIPHLIDAAHRSGTRLNSNVFVDNTDRIDPLVGYTAYRVVQELLTNARRHAPHSAVGLYVATTSGDITIESANYVESGRLDPGTGGGGLSGMAERVKSVGGEFAQHIDADGAFRVAVRLPATHAEPQTQVVGRR